MSDDKSKTTLDVVEKLFKELHDARKNVDELPPGCLPKKSAYQAWGTYIRSVRETSDVSYRDDGKPTVFAAETKELDIDVALYRWSNPDWCWPEGNFPEDAKHVTNLEPPCCKIICDTETWRPINWDKVRGVLFFVHGITENARFSILNCKPILDRENYAWDGDNWGEKQEEEMVQFMKQRKIEYTVQDSFLSQFLSEGFVVYAPDLPGHGLSLAWAGSRCNVQDTEIIVRSTVEIMTTLVNMNEIPEFYPIVLAGLSLGGCIATRTLQTGFRENLFKLSPLPSHVTDQKDDRDLKDEAIASADKTKTKVRDLAQPSIRALCLFCPALGAEKLKKKFPNNLLLPLKDPIARHLPKIRVISLARPDRYRWIPQWIVRDALIYTNKLPLRISASTINSMDRILPETTYIPRQLPLLIIQSKHDTMTDPEGSKNFCDQFPGVDKEAKFLDHGWHFLTKEAGYMKTAQFATEWLLRRF